MKFKINIEYNILERDRAKGEEPLSNSEITLNYINLAVSLKYKDGLEGQKRRLFGRIQRKLDDAVDNKKDEIELEEAEKDFLKGLFKDDIKMPSLASKYISLLEDEVDNLSKDEEKKKE